MQERELLAQCVDSNPCLQWGLITAAYNKAACGRSCKCRDGIFLHNMLRRNKHAHLQLSRCARALRLDSAAKVQELRAVLQAGTLATDSTALTALAQHGKHVLRLCKTAELSVLEALHTLPHAIGSREWVDNLCTQCEIEAEVHFWRQAYCKRSNIASASMQQVRMQVCDNLCSALSKESTAAALEQTDFAVIQLVFCVSIANIFPIDSAL